MSAYVISDIHGCYDELMRMLEKIGFSSYDTLVIAGDYIDRGSQNLEMLDWIADVPDNVRLLKGNHDVEFVEYVRLLDAMKKQVDYEVDDDSPEDTGKLYDETSLMASISWSMYDYYGTIRELINKRGVTLSRLKKWSKELNKLPYLYETDVNGKHFVVVHAGYVEEGEVFGHPSVEDFYMYSRDEAYFQGGKMDSVIVAGHTPTISHRHVMYTGGRIYKRYNAKLNCTYYDIDCGAVFRRLRGKGNIACFRLDDEKEFYLYEDTELFDDKV